MNRLTPARAGIFATLLTALACCLSGCGGGDGTHNVSGKVTFNGQPIPAGQIYFIPDGSKGNKGPTGYARIEKGTYDTSAAGGKPAVSGPVIVAIEGLDPSAPGQKQKKDTSGEQTVKALFPQYQTTAELPDEDSTKDFDVPAEAAKRPATGEEVPGGFINP